MKDYDPKEFKVVALRDCPVPESMKICEQPQQIADYWHLHVATHPWFTPDRECLVMLLLNTRKRVLGHHLVGIGTIDSVLIDPRILFRCALIAGASAIALAHNHPSGIAIPSDADIVVTRDIVRAGQLLKIEVVDHVVIGAPPAFCSLRAQGYCYT